MSNKTIILSKELRIGNVDNFDSKIGIINPNNHIHYSESGINSNYICYSADVKYSEHSWQYSKLPVGSLVNCIAPREELSKSVFKINTQPIALYFGPFNNNYPATNIYSSTYSVDKLTNNDLIILNDLISKDLITYNGKNGKDAYTAFFNDFRNKLCATRSTVPIFTEDPISKKPITYSSYFRSNTELGKSCLNWEATGNKQEVFDSKKIYCTANPESFECITMNPEKNNIYNSFLNPDKIPDQCWFTPFRTEFTDTKTFVYFFPEVKQDVSTCPKNITVKFNPDNTFKVTELEAKPYLSTSADGGGGGGGGGGAVGFWDSLSTPAKIIIIFFVVTLIIFAISPLFF